MEEIDVPTFFLCPISLEIMKDPVTVSTGITYDRESIEKWLFAGKNNTCPVTKQFLSSSECELTPNHTLRRLIQSWCTLNASYGIDRIPTPKPPVNKSQITKLLNEANSNSSSPQLQMKCLKKLRSIAAENETNKRCVESAGAVEFLASIVINYDCNVRDQLTTRPVDEALSILCNIEISELGLKNLVTTGVTGINFVDSLTHVLQRGTYESRAYAILLLKSMLEVADPMRLVSLNQDLFVEVVQILRDQISHQASQYALGVLVNICAWGRNRIKAVEAGAVPILIDLLVDSPNNDKRRACEMMLVVLDLLCQCAEGRAELLSHGAGLAVVAKKILRVSQVGSERAVRVLHSIAKFSASKSSVLQEMLQIGVVAKLCLVIQVERNAKTRDKAREVLQLHAKAWKDSPCLPTNLQSSYP